MIGSLIYYALYPLTKLIDRLAALHRGKRKDGKKRLAEEQASWWKGGPAHPVFINGKEVWDGGGAPCRRLSEQQTALLDQWLSAGSKPWEKPKPADEERGDCEGLVETRLLLVGEAVAGKNREQEKRLKSKEFNQDTEEKVLSVLSTEPDLEKVGSTFATNMEKDNDDLHEEKKEGSIPSGTDGMNVRLTEKEEVASMIEMEMRSTVEWAEMQAPAALGSKEEFSSQEEKKKKGNEETGTVREVVQPGHQSVNPVESEAQVGEGSCVFNLSMLLQDSHVESLNSFTNFKPEPAGWHFPVSLGFSETVYGPMQFPGISYYPTLQDNNNFEVMWRIWEDLSEESIHSTAPTTACSDPRSGFTFTVMSYNILAQDLLEAGSANLYVHCSEEVLAWDKRFHSIIKELQTWVPDIVCLQEVQENHFLESIQPALIEMGYICVYKRRTGTKTDGCAVCYNAGRFTQLSVSLLEFRRQDCELMDRDNVGIVLLLQPIGEHGEDLQLNPICVANTHLLFNPRRGDVKLAQLAIVLAEIDSVVKKCRARGSDCEIILCGDLNSLPNMPLYQLIVTGQLYYHGLPAWMVSGQEDLSYKIHHRRLYAPLWPSSLGISDNCQYSSVCEPLTQSSGKLQYNHDFLRQLRYCQAACVRPPDLELIPGVTDITPTPNPEDTHLLAPRFRNTIFHGFKLSSVYSPLITGTDRCAVTTLHSEGAAMVDYIFYCTGRDCTGDRRDGENGLKLLGRLTLLSEVDLWSQNGLPNEMFPSDHLSLLARFQLG